MGWAASFLAWMRARQAARDARTPPWIQRAKPPPLPDREHDLSSAADLLDPDTLPTPVVGDPPPLEPDTRPTLPNADRPASSYPPGRRKP